MNNRGMESLKRSGSASRKTKVSRKKQLQRLKPVEDERKLQTISIIEGLDVSQDLFCFCSIEYYAIQDEDFY